MWQGGGRNLCGGRRLVGMEVGENWLPAGPRTILTCQSMARDSRKC